MTRPAKQPLIIAAGVLTGLLAGWIGLAAVVSTGGKMVEHEIAVDDGQATELPLGPVALIVAVAVVLGLLMAIRRFGSAVMVGAGLLWSVTALSFRLTSSGAGQDVVRIYDLTAHRDSLNFLFLDGAGIFLGVLTLMVGAGRLALDARH